MSIKNFRERNPILIGVLSILLIAGGTVFAFSINKIPQLKQAYELKAYFSDAIGLTTDNQVRVAGIKVGEVSSIELVGDRVLVSMDIENDIQIPHDATASIKLATLLGTKFVNIDGAGPGPFLEDGDTIPLENTSVPYQIFQAANEGTGVLEGLNGPRLNKLLVELTELVRVSRGELGNALAGLNKLGAGLNERAPELRQLLAGADDLTKLLANEGDDINSLIDDSNTVLATLAQKREEIQTLLASTELMAGELADLVRTHRAQLDNILGNLHNALVVLNRNVEHLDVALKYAGASSRYFAKVFTQGRWGDIFSCALVLSATCSP
ncbi:MAG TPA: MCE family protein [Actinomycetota bacterium]|jgi:phospholipid/cholesterol/gamma-HCH transport system substrate-binding protein